MTLTPLEYKAYLSSHINFLYYIAKQKRIISLESTIKEFGKFPLEIKVQCNDTFHKDLTLLDRYLDDKWNELNEEQIEIIEGYRKKITSKFIIYTCLANHAIFIDTKDITFYAVKALGDRFDELFDHFPVLVEATLLPFKGKIIYDGFMKTHIKHIGSDLRASMKEEYMKANEQNRIVSTL